MLINVEESSRFPEIRPDVGDKVNLPHLAVICDYREENWPSMDLVAEMMISSLEKEYADAIVARRICPPMRRRLTHKQTTAGKLFIVDRFLNRFWDYPRLTRRIQGQFDLFHIVDHSYAQLLHQLPPERTIITCHDLNTFQSVLEPPDEHRSIAFKLMTQRILKGFRKASVVITVSQSTRKQLLAHKLVSPERIVVIPNCYHPVYSHEPSRVADEAATRWLGNRGEDMLDILHVGSNVPRKRLDVLLQVLALLRPEFPLLRLIRVGGPFTEDQADFVTRHKLAEAIVVLPYLEREVLAAVYRRATLVLQPSEKEGFGLPVIEAMACGTPVVASDIAALREAGGEACVYCPVGDVQAWVSAISELLQEGSQHPERRAERKSKAREQARQFSQSAYAGRMMAVYREVLKSHE